MTEEGVGPARRRRRQLDLAAADGGMEEKKKEEAAGAGGGGGGGGGGGESGDAGDKDGGDGGHGESAAGSEAGSTTAAEGAKGSRRRRKPGGGGGGGDAGVGEGPGGVGSLEGGAAARRRGSNESEQSGVVGSAAGSAKGSDRDGGGGVKSPRDGGDSARSKGDEKGGSGEAGSGVGKGKEGSVQEEPEEEDSGDGKVLQVTVHGTDELKPNIYLMHPVVQLSIIDTEDEGRCVKKKHLNRNVVLQHEMGTEPNPEGIKEAAAAKKGGEEGADPPPSPMKAKAHQRVLPVQTAPYDLSVHLREGRQLECKWEECIGLDEDFSFFMNPRFVFMFELMDFIHTTEGREKVNAIKLSKHRGWKRIAWAFLRPNDGSRKFVKPGERLRLQLYKFRSFWFWQRPKGVSEDGPWQVYQQWKAGPGNWKRYKSTLFVTVSAIERPSDRSVANRALMPWEHEEGDENTNFRRGDNDQALRRSTQIDALDKTRLGKKWIGATGKWCRVPNTCMHKLESDHRGCFVISFSSFGTFLACAVGGRQLYRIKIFNVATGSLAMTLPGHHEIVYDMQWGTEIDDAETEENVMGTGASPSKTENAPGAAGEVWSPKLVTASADTTAKVWDIEKHDPVAVCHHPAYVYCARFVAGPEGMRGETPTELADSASSFVVTGCYDHHLRLWNVSADAVGESGAAQIVKVISGHKSHINSIVVNPTAGKAFSADGIGVIRVWSITKHAFDSVKEVNEPEVKGDALNCLVLDKTGKRLFVLARDNCIRMLDTDSWKVTQRFSGLRCMNHQIRCDVSPDGKFLASGSEDGQIFMWNVETGEQDTSVSRDRLPHFGSMCSDVAWNPAERIVACCSFSRKQPVLVYKHERDVDNLANDEITEEEAREVLQGKFSELAEAFRRLDKNGDGKLQLDEFRSGMISLEMDMSDVQILRMFKAAAGPNDEIDRDEFIKRFAPTGTFQKIKTSENIERARQARMDQPKQRRSAVMGLLDELDGGKKKDANTPKKDQGKGEEESPKKKTLARKNR